MNSLVGTVVEDRYQIESELGAGAMGSVFRGRHIKVGRTVAIKVLHGHLVQEPTMVERFEREAMIAAKLKHPNLVAVIDLATTFDGQKCMVLEYAPGRCLADMVVRAMPRDRAIDVTRQLLLGLEHAHGLGLVHRDLKPENVLVEEHADGRLTPRIVDFGIAVLRDTDDTSADGRRLTTTGMVLGTPMYMAPEQAQGETVDARADLFALGVIVYELLAGKAPFEGSGVEIMMLNMMQDPPSVATRAGLEVDPLLEAFARKLMARDRNARFASATDALQVLDQIERDRDGAARALGLGACVPEPMREHDAVVTLRQRQNIVSTAMAPLAKTEIATPSAVSAEPLRVEQQPSRRRRWGTYAGVAAILAIALLVVALLAQYANAAKAESHGGRSPIQQPGGCTR